MALAARQTHIARGEDGIIAVQKDIVVDPESGLAAQVENITVAVDVGDGNIAVAQERRITVIQTEPQTERRPAALSYHSGQPLQNDYLPSYRRNTQFISGVKSQVQDAKQNSSNQGSFVVKLCEFLCGSAFCLICVLILAALPVAMIIIGSLYINKCSSQDKIPIWLIVFGCFALVQTAINISKRCLCKKKDDDKNSSSLPRICGYCLESVIVFFIIVWIIVGSVWVFGIWSDYLDNSDPSSLCDPVVYYFSFVVLIIIYIMSMLLCVCFCCCFCILVLVAGDSESDSL